MAEMIVVLAGAAVAALLWRGMVAQANVPAYAVMAAGRAPRRGPGMGAGGLLDVEPHRWPRLDRFDFAVVGAESHQVVLRHLLVEHGGHCEATLHTSAEIGEPVEVRVQGVRVGYLSDGDATRFQRRLAYEARPGQTSLCAARIEQREADGRPERALCVIWLDLKPFRH